MRTRIGLANAALLAGGLWFIGLGIYFAVFRPPLLREDERFLGASTDAALAALPQLGRWLDHVFDVLGGFMAALGALIGWCAAGQPTRDQRASRVACATAGFAAMAWMVTINFAISSDYRWLLAAWLAPWAIALWGLAQELIGPGSHTWVDRVS